MGAGRREGGARGSKGQATKYDISLDLRVFLRAANTGAHGPRGSVPSSPHQRRETNKEREKERKEERRKEIKKERDRKKEKERKKGKQKEKRNQDRKNETNKERNKEIQNNKYK